MLNILTGIQFEIDKIIKIHITSNINAYVYLSDKIMNWLGSKENKKSGCYQCSHKHICTKLLYLRNSVAILTRSENMYIKFYHVCRVIWYRGRPQLFVIGVCSFETVSPKGARYRMMRLAFLYIYIWRNDTIRVRTQFLIWGHFSMEVIFQWIRRVENKLTG